MKTNIKRWTSKRIPPWNVIGNTLENLGWFMERKSKNRIVFERGRERIIAHRFMPGKWKVDYVLGRNVMDSTGVNDEKFAKVMVMEMGVTKRF